jgi:pimeloyl-ACP methyl ester carboxylesterase
MPSRSSLARLLQLSVFVQFAAIAGWVAWRWPVSSLQALAGAVAVLSIGPAVLAVEFILSMIVSAADAKVPRASARQLVHAWILESVNLFRVFGWRQPFRWRVVPDHLEASCAGRSGIVFVHGFMCNRGFWNGWMRCMRAAGRGYAAVNLEPVFASIEEYAPIIDAAVMRVARATGQPPFLICHSMGGLAARAWWRARAGAQPIAGLVTIATPNQGTWMGRFSRKPNGRQMRLQSEWLNALQQDESRHALPATTCWYSNCDNIVFPAATATLAHADNRFVAGQPHVALAFRPEVLEGCLRLLEQADARRQGESFTGASLDKC